LLGINLCDASNLQRWVVDSHETIVGDLEMRVNAAEAPDSARTIAGAPVVDTNNVTAPMSIVLDRINRFPYP